MSDLNFLTKDNVVLDLDAKDQEDAISQLSNVLYKNGILSDPDQFTKDVLEREKMTTTGIGNNMAIPHGKSSTVEVPSMVFAKNKKPLEWNSLDGSKVNMIFLMAVTTKPDSGKEHLRMLSHLSGKLMDDDFVSKLKETNDKDEILKLLQN